MSTGPVIVSEDRESERREFEALLKSAAFSRAPNLHRFLEFIGAKYFEGKVDEIKEYTVAIHALNRGEDFDPRADTIVRVTAVALRKRLEQYYAAEGAAHPVHVELPPGQYVPRFIHRAAPVVRPEGETPREPEAEARRAGPGGGRPARRVAAVVAALAAVAAMAYFVWPRVNRVRLFGGGKTPPPAAPVAGETQRFVIGEGRPPYVDAAGVTWRSDTVCAGGRSFQRPVREIHGTDDGGLFLGGREGKFECRIPAPAGTYEVHVFFADTAGGRVAQKQVAVRLNGTQTQFLDVVDDAGAPDTATQRTFIDVVTQKDGTILVESITDDSFFNALEIVPSLPGRPLPLRILAGRATLKDQEGRTWLPDRYFFGGRRTYRVEGLPNVPNQGLFQWERFGRFRYNLPVVPGRRYIMTLYFSEGWFGAQGGGSGGVGSRVFDVFCNGTTLLRNFDILKEQQNNVVVKTFRDLEPTALGKLELSFSPVTNYPLVNAIEVVPEE
jgi:hypothetical protein